MDILLFNIISVFVGILLFIYALVVIFGIWKKTEEKGLKIWWLILGVLVTFFLCGYALFLSSLFFRLEIAYLTVLVAQIFLWGAVFVILSFKLFQTTLNQIIDTRQALRKSFEATKTILEQMPFGVIIVGKDKKVRSVNEAALKVFGAEKNKIVGQICHQNICPAEVGQCPILDLGKTVDNSEKIALGPNGKKVPILKTVIPITLEGEEVLLETFVDISERKKMEEELKEKMKQLEIFYDAAIGRELKMKKMEEELEELKKKAV